MILSENKLDHDVYWSSDIHKLTSIVQRFGPGQSAEADQDQYFLY